jgi:hypothetical protein
MAFRRENAEEEHHTKKLTRGGFGPDEPPEKARFSVAEGIEQLKVVQRDPGKWYRFRSYSADTNARAQKLAWAKRVREHWPSEEAALFEWRSGWVTGPTGTALGTHAAVWVRYVPEHSSSSDAAKTPLLEEHRDGTPKEPRKNPGSTQAAPRDVPRDVPRKNSSRTTTAPEQMPTDGSGGAE